MSKEETPGISPMKIFLRLLVSPLKGWKRLARITPDAGDVARGTLFPLTALCAALHFCGMFYDTTLSISTTLIGAVIVFVDFFLGYYAVLLLAPIVSPREVRSNLETNFFKSSVAMAMSSLALFFSLYEILPMLEPILFFAPLYTIYLIVRAVRFYAVPKNRETLVAATVSMLVILVPLAVNQIFTWLLPSNLE